MKAVKDGRNIGDVVGWWGILSSKQAGLRQLFACAGDKNCS